MKVRSSGTADERRLLGDTIDDISARGTLRLRLPALQSESGRMAVRITESADVADTATLGDGSTVWHLAQVREGARLGRQCMIGRGAYIGTAVELGDNCKVQNYALVYEPAHLGSGVFVGPAVVFTNDHFPRAVTPAGAAKTSADWDLVGVTVEDGASIGARSVCVAPVTIGAWSLVAAGSVVTKDVRPHALVVGVPARQVGWVGRDGVPLQKNSDGVWASTSDGSVYREVDGNLVPDTSEEAE